MKLLSPSVIGSIDVPIPLSTIMLIAILRTPGFVAEKNGGDIYWVSSLCMIGVAHPEKLPCGETDVFCQVFNNMVLE